VAEGVSAELSQTYREMYRVREFEEAAFALYKEGLVAGSIHLCTGQEAIPVGTVAAMADGDRLCCTYRGHGWAVALGCDPAAVLGELIGRASGLCGGRASAMNMFDVEHRLVGCYSVIGGPIGAAAGVALASSLRGEADVAVAVVGDGAANQAYFHESLNMAALWKLPLVVICENNLYGEWTPLPASTAGGDIASRAAAYGIPGAKVDGNDPEAVREAVAAALAAARRGEGPGFLECLTYRHYGHSKDDPGAYRPPAEVREWQERDPLPRLAAQLEEREREEIEREVRAEMAAAKAEAAAASWPELGSLGLDEAELSWAL
jgi:acetoin:2,6-dichlorophenolindophenol oxidoreductase subunit alpha